MMLMRKRLGDDRGAPDRSWWDYRSEAYIEGPDAATPGPIILAHLGDLAAAERTALAHGGAA